MIGLSRWCMTHRRWVMVSWLVVAVAANVIASAVGRHYATNFTLPGTESQHVADLLSSQFKSQSGDIDTIVFHNANGRYDAANAKAAIESLLHKVARDPQVVSVLSPFTPQGAVQVSKDGHTAFATVNYSKRANLLPDDTGKPVLDQIDAVHVPGLQIAAGGQVIEQAEGFSIGPATGIGVIAALVILLLTFGSLVAAGLPLITAGLGLITGIALIGLATRITSVSNVGPDLALMIGLGVGVDYALFIITRFRESYARIGDVDAAVVEAMDTSGRAILLAGTTVVIALLGMFATGVSFMYGLSIASVLAVLLVLVASLTLVPALLSRFGSRVVRPSRSARRREQSGAAPRESAWRRWSVTVQSRAAPLALLSLAVMLVCLIPFFSLRLQSSDAGNDPTSTSTYRAFNLLSQGFGQGFNGPLLVAVEMPDAAKQSTLPQVRAALTKSSDVVAVTAPQISPSGKVAVMEAYPGSSPQAPATTDLVNKLRQQVFPPLKRQLGVRISIGGFTAGSIDFSHVLSKKLPLFIAIVVVLSALLLLVIFRSLVIPLQAAVMNLLSIGGALGATVAVFQYGWGASVLGITAGPIEPWIPVLMFAVVFGLSMDYEVFLISRVREEWVHKRDASLAVADGISFTGRVITAAAAIMVCVFLSFMLGDQRSIKEFGFGLAVAVFLDALVVRCVMLPAVLQLLGPWTWKLPSWLDARLPQLNIEGSSPAEIPHSAEHEPEAAGTV
ncbi:MAG TPA: MMPL family transporter [Solirubrobacteraceae bacterium]|jgi:RND superfamily putative drug exporter|nr:MMPL family transporter [Solirubrobacteraceae bacterium]